MRWVRTFPAQMPAGRAYVSDMMERVYLSDYDMTCLAGLDDDLLICEWDMALSREDREQFETTARRRPDQVTVAPYLLYTVAQKPVFAHRLVDTRGQESWITERDWFADYVGFGLIYLPRSVLRAFLSADAPERGRSPFLGREYGYGDCRLTDQTFSVWHRHKYGQRVFVEWAVRPVHLHY